MVLIKMGTMWQQRACMCGNSIKPSARVYVHYSPCSYTNFSQVGKTSPHCNDSETIQIPNPLPPLVIEAGVL